MAGRSLETRVGITVVLASLICIIGIMWFQRFKLVEKRYDFYVWFPAVGGLDEDDPIMINGVEKGRVGQIDLQKHGVLVEMGINEKVTFPVDSEIALRSIGIMGERFVSIRTGEAARVVQQGDTLMGSLGAGMSEVMGQAGNVLDQLVEATTQLNSIFSSVSDDGQLKESMDNLHAFSQGLRSIVDDNGYSPLNTAVKRFENVSVMMDSLIGSRYASLDSSMESFSRAGVKMETLVDNLNGVSTELKLLTEKIKSGEGTLGQLINDDALLIKLDATVGDLDSLIIDIKQNPGRYMSFRLF